MKKITYLFVFLFFLSLSLISALTFLFPAKTFSEDENRILSQFPHAEWGTVKNGEFQSELSDALSDQIPLRKFWIGTSTVVKKVLGKQEINDVYIGKDHYYFQQFTEDSYSVSRMDAVFRQMEDFICRQGLPSVVMPVPTPGTVLKDNLPDHAPIYSADSVYETAVEILSCPVIDLREIFAENAEHFRLYYRTDHHWTSQGALLAYQIYSETTGAKPALFRLEEVTDRFYGTLYSRVIDPFAKPDAIYAPVDLPTVQVTCDNDQAFETVYRQDALSEKDKYTFFFGGNYGKIIIKTTVQTNKKLLVIKDSFANCFVPYLLRDYAEIVMLDLRYFGGDVGKVCEDHEITDILFLYEMSNLLTDTGILKLEK